MVRIYRSVALISATLFLMPMGTIRSCAACLWDYDTLAMERQRFPNAQELIVGHFVRHSPAYYRWRIEDRKSKPDAELSPEEFDDIAVAQDKLGLHEESINTIKEKMRRWPERGNYESAANLGTFLIHSGRLEEGVKHIERAIKINPDAHFGREVYQRLVVKYVLERREHDAGLPLSEGYPGRYSGFAAFLLDFLDSKSVPEAQIQEEIQAATKGVLGMMRFGQFESPILLECLGDLMMIETGDGDAKMLASRAYLKASYHVDDAEAATAYREKASLAIQMIKKLELRELEEDLKSEIAQAQQFFDQIEADEKQWVEGGDDLDRLFAKHYYASPELQIADLNKKPGDPVTNFLHGLMTFALLALVIALAISVTVRKIMARRRIHTP